MAYFRIGMPGALLTECYWVQAASEASARSAVGRSVAGMEFADDPKLYDCIADDTHTPPPGVVIDGGGHTYSGNRSNAHRT